MTDIALEELKAELTTDPAALGYAEQSPEQIHALMRASTTQRECLVPLDDLQAYLMGVVIAPAQVPVWWVLKAAAASDPMAEIAFDLFSGRFQNLNTRGPFQVAALAQLQSSGYIDQNVRDYIDALAVETVNRGELLFGRMPTVLELHVAMAS